MYNGDQKQINLIKVGSFGVIVFNKLKNKEMQT